MWILWCYHNLHGRWISAETDSYCVEELADCKVTCVLLLTKLANAWSSRTRDKGWEIVTTLETLDDGWKSQKLDEVRESWRSLRTRDETWEIVTELENAWRNLRLLTTVENRRILTKFENRDEAWERVAKLENAWRNLRKSDAQVGLGACLIARVATGSSQSGQVENEESCARRSAWRSRQVEKDGGITYVYMLVKRNRFGLRGQTLKQTDDARIYFYLDFRGW